MEYQVTDQLASKVPEEVKTICKTLKTNGFEAYCVGGAVRDILLGKDPKDWDIASNAKPDDVISLFEKVIPTGIAHGTVTVMVNGVGYEITTYRGEGEYSDGRRPDEVFFVNSIQEDLKRRDFTINAMAYDPIENKLVDPFGGAIDLKNKKIKAVGDPNKRFEEDSLRTMRAARFVSKLGFTLDEETQNAIANHSELLLTLSKERVRDELLNILKSNNAAHGIQILADTGVLGKLLPQIFHNPLLQSNLSKIDQMPAGRYLEKFTILVNGLPVSTVDKLTSELKFSSNEMNPVSFLVRGIFLSKSLLNHSSEQLRDMLAELKKKFSGDFVKAVEILGGILLVLDILPGNVISNLVQESSNPVSIKDLNIDGNILMQELNIKGKEIGELQKILLKEVIQNPSLNTKEQLLDRAKMLLNKHEALLNKCNNFEKLAN